MAESRRDRSTYGGDHCWSPRQAGGLNNDDRQALLDQARAGSIEAHGKLLISFWPLMRGYFYGGLSQKIATKVGDDDLAQEACCCALSGFAGFAGATLEQYRAWLMKICQNLLAAIVRRYLGAERELAREEPLDERSLDADEQRGRGRRQPTPEEIIAGLQERAALDAALNRLPAEERLIVVWRQFEELTFIEIADRLRRTRRVVERAFHRAFTRLRAMLTPAAL